MSEQNSPESDFESAQLVESPQMLESIERAQIDMQISTARKYPRKLSKVKDDMLSFACLDEETASGCFYTLPRGGKVIQGPSVRLAEIAISSYGNLRAGSRCISVQSTGDNPHVVVQSVCHDLEKNVAITIEKRRRITKKRSKNAVDEDDINLAVNACASIALRDAVFRVIPLALVKPVYEQAKLVAIGKATSLADKRGKIIDRLKQMGATLPNILAVVDARTVEDVDADKLGILIGLGTALKDGETTIEEAFPNPKLSTNESIADVLGEKDKAGATGSPKSDAPKSDAKAASEEKPASEAYTEQQFKALVNECENYALNLGITGTKLMEQAKALGATGKPQQCSALPYATLQTLRGWLETEAKKATA